MQAAWRRAFLLAVATALVASGCVVGRVHRGAPLRGDPSELVEGKSTKADVLRLLGPPDTIRHQTDGDAFMYSYVRRNFSSFSLREPFFIRQTLFRYQRDFENRDTLIVLFDYGGVVRAVGKREGTEDLPML